MITTVQFGLLTCVTIGLAMLGDLIVLPALLAIWKPSERAWSNRRGERSGTSWVARA